MTITEIKASVSSFPLPSPFVTAVRRADSLDEAVITVQTDCGVTGYGAASQTAAVTGDTPGSVVYAAETIFAPMFIGRVLSLSLLDEADRALMHNSGAKAALDMAFYDALSKHAGQPLYAYLGGRAREMRTDVTISAAEPAKTASDALSAVQRGFSILKIKLGRSMDEDLRTLRALRSALPDGILLRLDANQAWSVSEAVSAASECERLGLDVDFIEQPTPYYDLDALGAVAGALDIPVLADESAYDLRAIRAILERGCADMINIKLLKLGGIRPSLEAVRLCAEYGAQPVMGCMLEGSFGSAAAVHFACAAGIDRLDTDAPLLCGLTRARDVVFEAGGHIRFCQT